MSLLESRGPQTVQACLEELGVGPEDLRRYLEQAQGRLHLRDERVYLVHLEGSEGPEPPVRRLRGADAEHPPCPLASGWTGRARPSNRL